MGIGKFGPQSFAEVVRLVALLNLTYFGFEFAVALNIGSVSLFADSVDFLEDASVNLLILIALDWSARARARVGMVLAPGLATLWTAGHKLLVPIPPDALPLTITGFGALAVNLTCAYMLVRYKHHGGSLSRAAFLSARNDVLANMAIMAAGGLTALYPSRWPDLLVGVGIAVMNLDAAKEVFEAAKREHAAEP